MAQNYQVTPPFAGQQQFSESIYQLAASNGLGRPQAKYSDIKLGIVMLVFGLFLLLFIPIYHLAELPKSLLSTPDDLLSFVIPLVLFLLFSFCFISSGCCAAPALLAHVEPGADPLRVRCSNLLTHPVC
jgi:hypothetical protein